MHETATYTILEYQVYCHSEPKYYTSKLRNKTILQSMQGPVMIAREFGLEGTTKIQTMTGPKHFRPRVSPIAASATLAVFGCALYATGGYSQSPSQREEGIMVASAVVAALVDGRNNSSGINADGTEGRGLNAAVRQESGQSLQQSLPPLSDLV